MAEHAGYLADSTSIAAASPQKDTLITRDFYLTRFKEKGDKIVIENLYYDFDKYNIRPDAALILDRLAKVLIDNPTLKVELSSHTDSRGSEAYNKKLSQRRAEAAVAYIVRKGIDGARFIAKGYGETRLINSCSDGVKCTVAEHLTPSPIGIRSNRLLSFNL